MIATALFGVCLVFMYWLSAIAVVVVAYCFYRYVRTLGTGFAFAEIIAIIAVMQWLLGPVIAFYVGDPDPKYRMYVSEQRYMSFAVPAVSLFVMGLFWYAPNRKFSESIISLQARLVRSKGAGIVLIALGLLLDFAAGYLPSSLGFVMFLVAQFKYIGVLYLLMGGHRYRWVALFLVLILSVWTSAESGLFHNLILWGAFIFSYIAYILRMSNKMKVSIMVLGLLAMAAIQTVKAEYRVAAEYYSGNRVALLLDLIFDPDSYDQYDSAAEYFANLNIRMNQGWIISAVLQNVPQMAAHANGETILAAVSDSLVPRIMVDKRGANVSENFQKYTGLPLAQNTSMGISVLGEAYVNFATLGGIVFMGAWGFLLSWVLMLLVKTSVIVPTILLWVPLIFLQTVKAETEMVVVLNHAVKAGVVVAGFYFGARSIGWKI